MKCPKCGTLAIYEPGAFADEDRFRCPTGHWSITREEAKRMREKLSKEVSPMPEPETSEEKLCDICGRPRRQGHHHKGSTSPKQPITKGIEAGSLPVVRRKTDDGKVHATVLKMRPPEVGSKIQIFFANVEGTEGAVKIALDALAKAIESKR